MKHVAAISMKPSVASATDTTIDVATKITFIENILEAFKPLLQAKESAVSTT